MRVRADEVTGLGYAEEVGQVEAQVKATLRESGWSEQDFEALREIAAGPFVPGALPGFAWAGEMAIALTSAVAMSAAQARQWLRLITSARFVMLSGQDRVQAALRFIAAADGDQAAALRALTAGDGTEPGPGQG